MLINSIISKNPYPSIKFGGAFRYLVLRIIYLKPYANIIWMMASNEENPCIQLAGLLILSILYCENINIEVLSLFRLSEKKLTISHSNNETQQLNLKNIFTILLKTTYSIKESLEL